MSLRALHDDDADALTDLLVLAFGFPASDAPRWWDVAGRSHVRVLERQGLLAGSLVDIPMGIFLAGRAIPLHGIAGVVVAPELRGQGVGQALMEAHLTALRDQGVPLSALYASTRGLYRRVGYGIAGTHHAVTLPTAALRRVGHTSAAWRRLTAADRPVIEALYRQRAKHRDGYLDRGPYVWSRVWTHRGPDNPAWLLDGPEGPRAWVVVRQERRDDGFLDLTLVDHGAIDAEALRAVAGFVGGFGSMARTTTWTAGPRCPLLDLLVEHEAEVRLVEPWMLRVIDVPAALRARGTRPGRQLDLRLRVDDPLFAANGGPWHLRARDGGLEVEATTESDAAIHVRGLAALLTGHATADDLVQRGLLDAPSSARDTLDGMFSGPAPGMPDFF